MIITNDGRIKALLRGERPLHMKLADFRALHDAVHALAAAATLGDALYVGIRIWRVVEGRRRRYYLDVGRAYWIYFEWRIHDAIKVRIVRLRRTTVGSARRR